MRTTRLFAAPAMATMVAAALMLSGCSGRDKDMAEKLAAAEAAANRAEAAAKRAEDAAHSARSSSNSQQANEVVEPEPDQQAQNDQPPPEPDRAG